MGCVGFWFDGVSLRSPGFGWVVVVGFWFLRVSVQNMLAPSA